jgi:hypothetical protein
MNDYLIHRVRDIPRVAREGLRLRSHWPEDLKRFVRSPEHLRIMREYRTTGALYTNAWTAERFDPGLILKQGTDRLAGRVEAVAHH